MHEVHTRMQRGLELRAHEGADLGALAAAAAELWAAIHAHLAPLVGSIGASAIYRSSLGLESAQFPSLAMARSSATPADDFVSLGKALATASPADALLAHGALLTRFCSQLARLVGAALAERVLAPLVPPLDVGASGVAAAVAPQT
ncbi:MAG: hypothetical protein GC161_02585 [Planctomycetaceae bacterium]|nr:hypothetical protein [Planctomycetaceae bacterium]